jgi:hypothetical protein
MRRRSSLSTLTSSSIASSMSPTLIGSSRLGVAKSRSVCPLNRSRDAIGTPIGSDRGSIGYYLGRTNRIIKV